MRIIICISALSAVLSISDTSVFALEYEDLSSCKRGWGATEAGDHTTAIKLFETCIKNGNLSPKSMARTYRNLGITHRRKGEPRKAIEFYNKAISLQPADPWDDYVDRGNAWSDLGEYANAFKDFDLAFKAKPNYNGAYYNRGIVFEKQNQLEKAKADFIKAYEYGLRSEQLYDRFVKYGLVK
jgi:tetratricopeptide (TPR) repeat protein